MTSKTEAIILSLQKKGDNSSLLYAYTRESGRAMYMVYGNKWKSTLQPMALVELSTQHNPTRETGNLVSAERTYVPTHQDVSHYCMTMFMSEVIDRSVQHPMAEPILFDWLEEQIKKLDQMDELEGFREQFTTGLSQLLGYGGQFLEEWRKLKSLDVLLSIE